MNRKQAFSLFAGVLFVFSIFSVSFGATYYLEADGSGDFATVQDAINSAIAGDVIVLNPGRF